MPVLEGGQVSLKEVLDVRGKPLEEWELWSVLFQTVLAVQDIITKGQACKDGKPEYLVTPDNVLCTGGGCVILSACSPAEIKRTLYWCKELEIEDFRSHNSTLDKVYVFTIGQTISFAAHFGSIDKNQQTLSPLLKTVFQAMCQVDLELRMILSDVAQVCNIHAQQYLKGNTFAQAVAKLNHELLGHSPEHEIATQSNQGSSQENCTNLQDNVKKSTENQRLNSGGPLATHSRQCLRFQILPEAKKLSARDRWKDACRKVTEMQKSQLSIPKNSEPYSSWMVNKTHSSIFRVYEELTERRKMLELLRMSINMDPIAASDVEKNPVFATGLKTSTIAELVLLLQRRNNQSTSDSCPSKVLLNGKEESQNGDASCFDCRNYENHFYNLDKIALSQPFPSNKYQFDSFSGPEFIINKIKPHTRLVPFCKEKEFHKAAFTVIVHLLTGETLDIECVPSILGKQLYQTIADHLNLRERYLFGLAYMHGDEHIFIDRKQRMLDLLHSCSAIAKNKIQLHLRVKFFLNNAQLLRTPSLRHMFYLQLRKDFLDNHFSCDKNTALTLGGLALQAEFANYESLFYSQEYFVLEHYLCFSCIKEFDSSDIKSQLKEQHMSLNGVSKELAELRYIEAIMKMPEYGCHFYKVFQDKHNISSAVWLGIKTSGLEVFEKLSGKRSASQIYLWENIKRISFCKKYFCISPRTESHTGKHVVYRFYTSVLFRSHYLFNIAMSHHKFFLKLKTISKASEIFIEDLDEEHLYFCDKSGMEKEIGCDLSDGRGKFQLKTKTLRHRSSSQNDLEFLNDPYVLETRKAFHLNQTLVATNEMQEEKVFPRLVARSSSAPNPMKKTKSEYSRKLSLTKELSPRVPSTVPRSSCGKPSMKFVRLHKDPKSGFGMVITCGSTYDTVLHGAFVESIHPNSPANLNGNIGPGDQIMSVNGTDVQRDHYLTVVDLLQYSSESVDLIISKAEKSPPNVSSLIKEITEIPFTKSKAWVVGNSNTLTENNNSNLNMPIPKPRKKWLDQEKPLNVPDLTLNHASHPNLHKMQQDQTDPCSLTQGNIPDIIASQMKQIIANGSGDLTESLDDNFLLPGEVFHVVLDKKRGSLGLNIYQGTESAGTEQRYIYIHSVIPNGAADLDGRIKPGDKLLEVNGAVLVNLSYQEVVTKLRESPQVAHLVLEKGALVETHELIPKNNNCDNQSDLPKNDSIKRKHSTSSAKFSEYITQQETTQRNSEGFKDSDSTDQMSYSSLPTTTNQSDSSCFDSAKDTLLESELSLTDSDSNGDLSLQDVCCSKKDSSSPLTYAKAKNSRYNASACRFNGPLSSYSSTPNLAETSDEDEKAEINRLLYRNKSTDCLSTPHFMAPHQALEDFYHNYSYVRGPSSTLPQFPVLPIRKRKLKKLDDVYNYCNTDTTFDVCIRKSSRGLGISIFGGSDTIGCDTFSQLIRIRKLYPLQPALECGKLALGDVILEVNGCKMVGLTNTQALDVLRCAATDVTLKVFRPSKSLIPSVSTYKGVVYPFFSDSSSSACSSLSHTEANTYNVETGEFDLTLVKRNGSLGFTISKVESSKEGIKDGIYVKALIREPAVSDGRIHPGDRILEVNGMDISPLTHVEAIAFLRNSSHSVTLKLYRSDPPLTPGCIENYLVTKPLRWEAVEFLNDHQKSKDSSDESSGTSKKKLNRKFQRASNAPSLASSTESESSSSNSSNGQEHIVEDAETSECGQEELDTSDLGLDGVGLQRNQRPKSLDMLNSSDRKRCPDFQQQESFHRQSSVICPKNGEAAEKERNLMKWRGSTLPHSEEATDGVGGILMEDGGETVSDEDRPVPFPRSTSCAKDWVNTFDVDLDRGWHGRLGFSLFDPPPTSPNSPRDLLPKAAEVKAVFPNSLAEKDGRIKVGDRLVEVNRESFLGRSAPDVIDTLRKTRGLLRMVFCRLESRT